MSGLKYILGVNLFHGDSSAALLVDGVLVSAVEEERFSREKHAAGVPYLAIEEVLRVGGIELQQVDAIAVGRDNRANLARKIAYVATHPQMVAGNLRGRLDVRKAASRPAGIARKAL